MVHQHVLIASDVEMSIVADPGKAKAIQSRVCNQNCPSFPNKNTSFRIPPEHAHATFVLMYMHDPECYKTYTVNCGLGIKLGLRYKTRTRV